MIQYFCIKKEFNLFFHLYFSYNNAITEQGDDNLNIFRQFLYSLYDLKKVSTFRFFKIGKAIRFVFLMAFIYIIPSVVYWTDFAFQIKNEYNNFFQQDKHHFEIVDGTLTTDLVGSHYNDIKDVTFMLNATEEISSSDVGLMHDANVAFLKDRFVLADNSNFFEFPYQQLVIGDIDDQQLTENFFPNLHIFIFVAALIFFFFFAAAFFFLVTILSVLGNMICQTMSRPMPYEQVWKLMAYSIAIPVTYLSIVAMLQMNAQFKFSISWILSLVIFILIVRTIPKKSTT